MKYLKLFENFEDIDSICEKYGIKNYTINEDGSIDVDGCVDLSFNGLTKLPIKFRNVIGDFDCVKNSLTTLKGCPISVGGFFTCNRNNLTKLDGCPKSVGEYFFCSENSITTLIGGPESVGRFSCKDNKIRTLEGYPINYGSYFNCPNNPVYELYKLFANNNMFSDKVELFNDFGITDGEVVILSRLNEFLEMIGKPIVTDTSGLKREGYKII